MHRAVDALIIFQERIAYFTQAADDAGGLKSVELVVDCQKRRRVIVLEMLLLYADQVSDR